MFSRVFAGELPEGAAKGFKARMEAWRAMTDEQKAVERERINQLEKAQREAEADLREKARRDRLRALSGIGSRFAGALLTDLDWEGNEPARTAAMAALSTRAGWFFGPVGAGKTHIAAAIIADAICAFDGCGTTLVAAKRDGRAFVGWEQDEKWFEAASARLRETVERIDLFAPPGVI